MRVQRVCENGELIDLFLSVYDDVIALTRRGILFELSSERLEQLSSESLKMEDDEMITESHMDNTRTSIFALTTKNKIYHIFLQKVQLHDGSFTTFKSRGVYRFHSRNVIFTFRVLTIPSILENCIQVKNPDNVMIQNSFIDFIPQLSNAKFIIYTLLALENDNMKIFTVDLSTHETLIQPHQVKTIFPIKLQESPKTSTETSKILKLLANTQTEKPSPQETEVKPSFKHVYLIFQEYIYMGKIAN